MPAVERGGFVDSGGFAWKDKTPVIATGRGGKVSDFKNDVKGKDGYVAPTGLRSFKHLAQIGLDIEGVDPDLKNAGPGAYRADGKVVGLAIGYSPTDATYYPTSHAATERNMPNPDRFYDNLRAEAAEFEGELVGANLQYDLDWLQERHAIFFPKAKLRDVQTAEPLIDENKFSYKLDLLAREYDVGQKEGTTLADLYGQDYIRNMDRVDPGHAAEYCEMDTMLPMRILAEQKPILTEQGLDTVFDIECRVTPLLLQMRRVGVRVDVEKAEIALEGTIEEAKKAKEQLKDACGFYVDIWSAPSIARAFDKRGVEYPKTKTGKPSFRKDWLNACPDPVAQLINDQRGYEKIGGTFLNNYIIKGAEQNVDGRLHCMFNQLKADDGGTVSGRFSSSYPNLQNIPARHPVLGPLCRSLFIPEEDQDWGSADWSQIEYRFLVHYAELVKSIDASKAVNMYREDKNTDFHTIAAEIAGVQRSEAKSINFGVVYGMGVATMAATLGVTYAEAEKILNEFHEQMPFLKEIYNVASARAGKYGYIKTILGRRRRFDAWECKGKIFQSRDEAQTWATDNGGFPRVAFTHKALNALLQGSAADLMKFAMVKMYEDGVFNVLTPHLTVHDEMDVSVPRTKAGKEAFAEMTHIMETAMQLEIPILADAKIGATWKDTK
jgi:DNA polymerase I-like protein with 3'-5' exonuclease and polymerase domains